MGDADAQDELKRLLAQAATKPRQARESGWGTNRRIGKIYAAPYARTRRGRVTMFLQLWDLAQEQGLPVPRTSPMTCRGPRIKEHQGWGGRFACEQELFCGHCWDGGRHLGAQQAAERHLHGGEVQKVSLTQPLLRTDPPALKLARHRFIKAARGLGYRHYTIWVHTFGERPFEGPKGHLDGYLSAPEGEDPEPLLARVLDDKATMGIMHQDLAEALADAYKPGQQPVMAARPVDLDARRGMRDFILGAQYASRETFPTLRLIAGQLSPKGDAYRFTNVDGSNCRRPQKIVTVPNPRSKNGLFDSQDILAWLETAATWNRGLPMAASRRIKPLGRHHLAYEPHDWSRFFGYPAASWQTSNRS